VLSPHKRLKSLGPASSPFKTLDYPLYSLLTPALYSLLKIVKLSMDLLSLRTGGNQVLKMLSNRVEIMADPPGPDRFDQVQLSVVQPNGRAHAQIILGNLNALIRCIANRCTGDIPDTEDEEKRNTQSFTHLRAENGASGLDSSIFYILRSRFSRKHSEAGRRQCAAPFL